VRAQAESTQLRHVNAFLRARSSTVDLRLQALITPQVIEPMVYGGFVHVMSDGLSVAM
jgi:hypothetical protein